MTRVFRVERFGAAQAANDTAPSAEAGGNGAIMAALDEIRQMLRNGAAPDASAAPPDTDFLERFRADIAEAAKLKAELDSIHDAIADTKTEIATLRFTGLDGEEGSRVTDELGAVVQGTEHATEAILSAAEAIDENANTLSAKLKGGNQGLANDIQEQVVQIFEACNFQDLSGQRITKVVNAMRFIEERVDRMMAIWGGIDTFSDIATHDQPQRVGDATLLNGPALDSDEGLASQDDIDALFD